MIKSFKGSATKDIFDGNATRAARALCPEALHEEARRKLQQVDRATNVLELREPPENDLHPTVGHWGGQYQIHIRGPYHVSFRWPGTQPEDVQITDMH